MTYISSCQKVMNGKISNSIMISLISDYLLEKASVLKYIYVGTGQFCYSEKIHSHYLCTSVIFKPQRSWSKDTESCTVCY